MTQFMTYVVEEQLCLHFCRKSFASDQQKLLLLLLKVSITLAIKPGEILLLDYSNFQRFIEALTHTWIRINKLKKKMTGLSPKFPTIIPMKELSYLILSYLMVTWFQSKNSHWFFSITVLIISHNVIRIQGRTSTDYPNVKDGTSFCGKQKFLWYQPYGISSRKTCFVSG